MVYDKKTLSKCSLETLKEHSKTLKKDIEFCLEQWANRPDCVAARSKGDIQDYSYRLRSNCVCLEAVHIAMNTMYYSELHTEKINLIKIDNENI